MKCANCGADVPEGKYCPECGAPNQPASPDGTGTSSVFPASIPGQTGTTKIVSGPPTGWCAALIVVQCILLGLMLFCPAELLLPLTLTAAVIGLVCLLMDWRALSNVGICGGWKAWGLFVLPVYLFVRASKTNRRYVAATVSLIVFAAAVVLAIVNGFAFEENALEVPEATFEAVATVQPTPEETPEASEAPTPSSALPYAVAPYVAMQRSCTDVSLVRYLPSAERTLTYTDDAGTTSTAYFLPVSDTQAAIIAGNVPEQYTVEDIFYDPQTDSLVCRTSGTDETPRTVVPSIGQSAEAADGSRLETVPYLFALKTDGTGTCINCICVLHTVPIGDQTATRALFYAPGIGHVMTTADYTTLTGIQNPTGTFTVTDTVTSVQDGIPEEILALTSPTPEPEQEQPPVTAVLTDEQVRRLADEVASPLLAECLAQTQSGAIDQGAVAGKSEAFWNSYFHEVFAYMSGSPAQYLGDSIFGSTVSPQFLDAAAAGETDPNAAAYGIYVDTTSMMAYLQNAYGASAPANAGQPVSDTQTLLRTTSGENPAYLEAVSLPQAPAADGTLSITYNVTPAGAVRWDAQYVLNLVVQSAPESPYGCNVVSFDAILQQTAPIETPLPASEAPTGDWTVPPLPTVDFPSPPAEPTQNPMETPTDTLPDNIR